MFGERCRSRARRPEERCYFACRYTPSFHVQSIRVCLLQWPIPSLASIIGAPAYPFRRCPDERLCVLVYPFVRGGHGGPAQGGV